MWKERKWDRKTIHKIWISELVIALKKIKVAFVSWRPYPDSLHGIIVPWKSPSGRKWKRNVICWFPISSIFLVKICLGYWFLPSASSQLRGGSISGPWFSASSKSGCGVRSRASAGVAGDVLIQEMQMLLQQQARRQEKKWNWANLKTQYRTNE